MRRRDGLAAHAGTLALAAVGGGLAAAMRLPLAWMLGAMAATTVAAIAGAPVRVQPRLRAVMIVVLGLMLGSAFSPATLGQMRDWWPSVTAMLGYVVVITAIVAVYFRRVGLDPVTAFFAGAPGGLNDMSITGGALGGDEGMIALVHGLRILLIVSTIPLWFRVTAGYTPQGTAILDGGGLGLLDVPWLLGLGLGGWLAGHLIRLPAPSLTGPMLLMAVAEMAGLTAIHLPGALVAVAQVVTGAAIGCRFAGQDPRRMLRTASAAAGATAVMIGASVAMAWGLAGMTTLPMTLLLLAFIPGGLAEMCLISLALGADVAFVSVHHTVRVLLVVLLAPLLFKLRRRD